MRALLLALLALALSVLAVVPASVDAHRISLVTAAHKARSEALIISGSLPQRSRVSVRRCIRMTPHLASCRVRYRFVKDGMLTGQRCFQTIRVRFTSNTSRGLAVSFPRVTDRC
jgi:hypothetical protein